MTQQLDFATLAPETVAIHSGCTRDPFGSLNPPIYQTSTFVQDEPGVHAGYCYTRTGNPTRDALQDALAALEGGGKAFAFATGIAAENAVLQALLKPGAVVVVPRDLYGGTWRLLNRVYEQWGVVVRRVDFRSLSAVRAALPGASLVWAESPTNPRLEVYDLASVCQAARSLSIPTVVDNTFATPLGQRPLDFGADIVIHSVTKYLSGHSDVVLGAAITRDPKHAEQLAFIQNACGGGAAPFECWLALRGVRTFPLRFRQHCENARVVAQWLEKQLSVSRVYYPGLASHETAREAHAHLAAFGAVISLEVAGGVEAARAFASSLSLFRLAESLGGTKSLVCHPASMTHASVPAAERAAIGLSDSLVRLSVGLEAPQDLVADLSRGLGAIAGRVPPAGEPAPQPADSEPLCSASGAACICHLPGE
jgi:cystathionine gamma-lyase